MGTAGVAAVIAACANGSSTPDLDDPVVEVEGGSEGGTIVRPVEGGTQPTPDASTDSPSQTDSAPTDTLLNGLRSKQGILKVKPVVLPARGL